jgi:sigma-E factor negative regulatory protein RseC
MLTEAGKVVAVEPGWLWVETVRSSTCGSCAAAKGCGHGIMNRISEGSRSYLRVSTSAFPEDRFKVDDRVAIAIPERLLLDSALIVYGVPLVATLGGAALAAALLSNASDADTLLGAVLGFLAGLGLVRLHSWWFRHNSEMQPRLIGPARTD